MSDPYDAFAACLRDLVAEERMAKAGALTQRFWNEPYTGRWFHVLADRDHPNEITARDVVAVSTLSVTVPARVLVWLLSDTGRDAVTKLLEDIPDGVDLREGAELIAENSALRRLWSLLASACWPEPTAGNGMGRAKISKLLAAKRPCLVPILDSVVCGLCPPVPDYWWAFYKVMSDPNDRLLLSIRLGDQRARGRQPAAPARRHAVDDRPGRGLVGQPLPGRPDRIRGASWRSWLRSFGFAPQRT